LRTLAQWAVQRSKTYRTEHRRSIAAHVAQALSQNTHALQRIGIVFPLPELSLWQSNLRLRFENLVGKIQNLFIRCLGELRTGNCNGNWGGVDSVSLMSLQTRRKNRRTPPAERVRHT